MKKKIITVIVLLLSITLEAQKERLSLNGLNSVVLENFNLDDSEIQLGAVSLAGVSNLVKIHVQMPYFWQSIYFHLIFWLILIALIISFFKYKKNRAIQNKEKLEKLIADKTKELIRENKEKDILIQEVHHRVKNNLQFISSLISMQINAIKSASSKKILRETYSRINSMALVHEILYTRDNVSYISLKTYLSELINSINEMVHQKKQNIQINMHLEDIDLDISSCIALGMITNEAISNTLKHAFKNIINPKIDVNLYCSEKSEAIIFSIKDNGKGIYSKFLNKENKSLGLRLIGIFSKQLNATVEINNNQGTEIIIQFKCKNRENCSLERRAIKGCDDK